MRGFNGAGDSIVEYQLVATANTAGWTIRFPDREPIPVRVVAAAGDTVITEAGPYESVLRPGVQVRTNSTFRIHGDTLLGATQAHYTPAGLDLLLPVPSVETWTERAEAFKAIGHVSLTVEHHMCGAAAERGHTHPAHDSFRRPRMRWLNDSLLWVEVWTDETGSELVEPANPSASVAGNVLRLTYHTRRIEEGPACVFPVRLRFLVSGIRRADYDVRVDRAR